ncbi:Double-stranded RNA-binding protein Staufen 2 [Merluccius polli]|uniref:Double-stranded RNA-binding protein Staufen homolog 2 n=1 Tax=Merluccius polli TaxID=89951 RepID=A0AA47ME86_MERPO|nr:Double-stranded RNA-binding protein Staufen 2 [Merluccius polli]
MDVTGREKEERMNGSPALCSRPRAADPAERHSYHYPIPKVFYVQLSVGANEFIGEGRTRQAARHNAAMKALQALRNEPIPERPPQTPEEKEEQEEGTDASKSEISLVYEIALKRNLSVDFEVLKESGPPHMKSFLTRVSVGEFSAEGEGNSKKLSKKRAALSILQDLKKLPFIPAVEKPKTHYKKRPKTIIKMGPDYGQGMNPISRLAQIQQAKKEKEPEYLLLSERGMPRRREFIMQVKVNGEVTTGTGPNKKVAKRNAAEAMLLQQGYKASVLSPNTAEMDNKGWNGQKAPFTEATSNTQKGLLHLSPDVYQEMEASRMQSGGVGAPGPGPGGNYLSPKDPVGPYYGIQASPPSPTATMARELLLNGQAAAGDAPLGLKGKSPASSSSSSSCPSSSSSLVSVQPAQQLDYLARIQGFQVQYSDGQSGKEFVTYLTLSPVQMTFHGTGSTLQASHDQVPAGARVCVCVCVCVYCFFPSLSLSITSSVLHSTPPPPPPPPPHTHTHTLFCFALSEQKSSCIHYLLNTGRSFVLPLFKSLIKP